MNVDPMRAASRTSPRVTPTYRRENPDATCDHAQPASCSPLPLRRPDCYWAAQRPVRRQQPRFAHLTTSSVLTALPTPASLPKGVKLLGKVVVAPAKPATPCGTDKPVVSLANATEVAAVYTDGKSAKPSATTSVWSVGAAVFATAKQALTAATALARAEAACPAKVDPGRRNADPYRGSARHRAKGPLERLPRDQPHHRPHQQDRDTSAGPPGSLAGTSCSRSLRQHP